ncbi:MAG: NUDIX domain-containing protein [Dehalococcoidia bacterium]
MKKRRAVRVLLANSENELLLVHGQSPVDPDAGRWWFPVGGGIESGETIGEAARREILEETGIADIELGETVGFRVSTFPYFDDTLLEQHETYIFAKTTVRILDNKGWTDIEREQLIEMRWWSSHDLEETTEVIVPRKIPELWSTLKDGVYPGEPFDIGE